MSTGRDCATGKYGQVVQCLRLTMLLLCRGFIQHFFQCSACANHFIEMTEKADAESVRSRREAVLWMWKAHNQVLLSAVPQHSCTIHHTRMILLLLVLCISS